MKSRVLLFIPAVSPAESQVGSIGECKINLAKQAETVGRIVLREKSPRRCHSIEEDALILRTVVLLLEVKSPASHVIRPPAAELSKRNSCEKVSASFRTSSSNKGSGVPKMSLTELSSPWR